MTAHADPDEPSAGRHSREEEIVAVTIGPVDVLNGSVTLAAYDPAWPSVFAREAARVRVALAGRTLRIEHVGSTAVPGLAAKPIVDMLLVVADATDETAYVPPLEAVGYRLRIREPEWFQHRLFRGPADDINLHVFSEGCGEIDRMLVFRDWLRAHDDDRDLYLRTKRELAARTWKHVQNYADAKGAIIERIIALARPRDG